MRRPFRLLPRTAADPVVRLLVTHWILGAMLGMTCAALVIWLDVAGLRGLLLRADRIMWDGLALMFGGFAITFGGVVCASAVMSVPVSNDDTGSLKFIYRQDRNALRQPSDAPPRSIIG